MYMKDLDGFSPIAKNPGEDGRDFEMSSSWNTLAHNNSKASLTCNPPQKGQIHKLIARNKMARVLDCVFAKRIRYPFNLVKQQVLFSDTDLSKSSAQHSRVKRPDSKQIILGVDIVKRMMNKNNQKAKVSAFTFVKMILEDDEYSANTNPPEPNWLRRQQMYQGSNQLAQIVQKKANSNFRHLFIMLREPTRFKTEAVSKQAYNTRHHSTIMQERRSGSRLKRGDVTSKVLEHSHRIVLTENSQQFSRVRRPGPLDSNIIQMVYIMRDRSRSKSKYDQDKDKYLRIPLLSANIQIKEVDAQNGKPSKHKYSSSGGLGRTPSKQVGKSCGCQQKTNKKAVTCKFCKLFMNELQNVSTHRHHKRSFFNR